MGMMNVDVALLNPRLDFCLSCFTPASSSLLSRCSEPESRTASGKLPEFALIIHTRSGSDSCSVPVTQRWQSGHPGLPSGSVERAQGRAAAAAAGVALSRASAAGAWPGAADHAWASLARPSSWLPAAAAPARGMPKGALCAAPAMPGTMIQTLFRQHPS
jgi:hypothetical protein